MNREGDHEPGDCAVWSWCTSERWLPRRDEPTTDVLVHEHHCALVGAGTVEVVVVLQAWDRDTPAVVLSLEDQDDDRLPLGYGDPVAVAAELGAAGVQEVVTAMAEAVELLAEQAVAAPTLRDVRRAAGTSRASR